MIKNPAMSGQSPFAQVAQKLIANGYHPIPIMPGDKAPGEIRGGSWRLMNDWPKYRDQAPPEFILKLWSSWERGNVSIVTGTRITQTHEVAAIDFDTDQTDLLETMESSIPPSPVRKRGRRGYTAFYLAPIGTRGRKFKKGSATICEILTGTNTRQTVIPPSIHPNTGQPYVWMTDRTLLNTPATALPVLTEDMLERFIDTVEFLEGVEEVAHRTIDAKPRSDGEATVWGTVNETALRNLDAWVPALPLPKLHRSSAGYQAVAWWRPSSTGRDIKDRATNLGISPAGIKDFGTDDTYTALDLTMRATNWDLDTAFGWLSRKLGLSEDWNDVAVPQLVVEEPQPDIGIPTSVEPDELPDNLARPAGMLGEVVDWIVATARRPNRTLALGAAITVLGTLMGRMTAGPTLSGTHLYVVALAPSGAGKDHPLNQVMQLMKASSAGHLLGPDEFISMPAMINFLQRTPLAVSPMDEIGAFFKRLAHFKASPYEKSVTKMLRTVWGASFRSITTPEWGSKKMEEIWFPSLSIFGVSTPGEFFEALEGGDVVNGFLNRFLMLTSDARAQDTSPSLDPMLVPEKIAQRLATLYIETNRVQVGRVIIGDNPPPRRVPWADRKAEAVFETLKADVEALRMVDDDDPFYARTVEMAVRLATIHAVSRDPSKPAVTADDMRWGAGLAMWSARTMIRAARGYMAENQTQGASNRILRIIERCGGRISHRDLQRKLKNGIKSRDLADIIKNLVEAEILRTVRTIPPGGGTPTIRYEIPTDPA